MVGEFWRPEQLLTLAFRLALKVEEVLSSKTVIEQLIERWFG